MPALNEFLVVLLNIVMVFLITDILGAVGHWVMDSYGNPNFPILGRYIFKPNIDHHNDPQSLIENSWVELISTSIGPVLVFDYIIWLIWEINWQVILGSMLLACANIIHKCCHCTKEQNNWLVNLLHDLRIIQTPEHHAQHHLGKQDHYYAALTNFTNPFLEYFSIWKNLEYIIYKLTSLKPKSQIRTSNNT